MSDLEDKLKNLLASPDGMDQLLKTAQSLFGGSGQESQDSPAESEAAMETESEDTQAVSAVTAPAAQISGMFDGLDSIDPKVISTAMQLMSEYRNADDRRISLLHALKPYLKQEDQLHISKAVQMVKLSKVAKRAFSSFKEGDELV